MKKSLLFFSLFIFLFLPILCFAEQVDINSATLSQLGEIVHVGDKTAQKIIAARPYNSVNDLSRVKGIGNGKYLQDIITQGFACVNCETTQQTQQAQQTPQTDLTTNTTDTTKKTTVPTVYPGGVFINEILPSPKGSDETDEWIELYNSNSSDVDLSGWQFQDSAGTITTYTVPQNTKISANGFLIFKRPDTQIMLNNDQDGLNLLTPDKKIADSMTFTAAPLNQSYDKVNRGWQWSSTLTPGAVNIITAMQTKNSTKPLPKAKNSVKNDGVSPGLADLSQATSINQDQNNTSNPWFLFFTVLATTIILATIVLIIRIKFREKDSDTQNLTPDN